MRDVEWRGRDARSGGAPTAVRSRRAQHAERRLADSIAKSCCETPRWRQAEDFARRRQSLERENGSSRRLCCSSLRRVRGCLEATPTHCHQESIPLINFPPALPSCASTTAHLRPSDGRRSCSSSLRLLATSAASSPKTSDSLLKIPSCYNSLPCPRLLLVLCWCGLGLARGSKASQWRIALSRQDVPLELRRTPTQCQPGI